MNAKTDNSQIFCFGRANHQHVTHINSTSMANNPEFITFILGAGASFEVEMPTGNKLKEEIAASLSFRGMDSRNLEGGDDWLHAAFLALSAKSGDTNSLNEYLKVAKLIVSGMPQAPSIDNFIDSHRNNGRIAQVGKLAIASAILKAESKSTLYINSARPSDKLKFSRISDTWYNAFFQLICLNAQENDLPDRLSKVKVVTFNYDRTLEHFLFNSIQNYYGVSPDRAAEILSNLTILHPYGQVGDLPWQKSKSPVPFGELKHSSVLIEIAQNLKTFTEGTSTHESQISQIRGAISDAKILTFLGFAYHELNLELLFGRNNSTTYHNLTQVFGTAMGISESNKRAIANELAILGKFELSNITLRKELSAAQLLPEYSRSLRIPSVA